MSKTNHNRGFVGIRYRLGQKGLKFITGNFSRETIDGRKINAFSTVASENSKGVRRDRAGAKKFVNSRGRFYDRMACDRIIRDQGDE